MAKVKYYYDKETLSYLPVEVNRFAVLSNFILFLLAAIFFGVFTPIALFMRLIGRDELRLKLSKKSSHWISRSKPIKSETFKQQF